MTRFSLIVALLLGGACSKSKDAPAETPQPKAETPESAPDEPAAEAEPEPEPGPPELLAVGTEAPDFTVQDHRGEQIALADLRGKPVVLYWYPKDFTGG